VPGETFAISVIFQPGGAYPFFGVPMRALADRRVPLEELWGPEGRRLVERLLECRAEAQAVKILEQALTARLEREEQLELRSAVHVLRVVRRVVSDQPGIDVAGLAMRVGLSERQLRRIFATAVGVGPKEYLQMLRFNRAAARSTTMPGRQLAAAAGYYDQAHLISEFRHLAGMTPREFANRRRPEPRAMPRLTHDRQQQAFA
jgi:AraC-like DNA-binding protein